MASTSATTSTNVNRGNMAAEMYSLKWNAYQSHVTGGLSKLLQDNEYCDVTLVCGGQFLQAHKMILSLCSPLFKRMFQFNKTQQNGNMMVVLHNVRFQDLENIIHFIYNGEVQVRNADFESFLSTGETLQIEGLSTASSQAASGNTQPQAQAPVAPPKLVLKPGVPAGSMTIRETSLQNRAIIPVKEASPYPKDLNPPSNRPVSGGTAFRTNRGLTITSTRNDPGSISMMEDPLDTRNADDIDPLQFNGIEISEIRSLRGEREESSEHSGVRRKEEVDSFQSLEPGISNPEVVYDDTNSIQDDEEEYEEMTDEDFMGDSTQHLGTNQADQFRYPEGSRMTSRMPEYRTTTPYREQRRKTSALWDYFIYDTARDLVQCQLARNGRLCPFNARHKPLSNMKYHIRTCHPGEYEIILPRLLNRS